MMPAINLKEMMPFVRFEYEETGRDVDASIKAGRPVPMIHLMAIIMQHGSKDEHHAIADEWLATKRFQAAEGRCSPQWIDRWEAQLAAFKKGEELPRDGTPIKTWAALTREQVIRLIAFGITTVEDLAAQPDSSLMNMGLDGRNMRDMAKHFLAQGEGAAGTAKKMADMEEANRQQVEIIKQLESRLSALEKPAKKAA